ncbi:MAG: hypothetical protein ACRD0K_26265 [Egibacteraceae bacterium]
MSEPNGNHPDSERGDPVLEDDAVLVYPPCCHGARVLLPIGEAVPGATLRVVCPECGEAWSVAFAADDQAETALRSVWTEAKPDPGEDVEGERDGQS